jgi:hypothetical protein
MIENHITKIYRCFGYLILKNIVKVGAVFNDEQTKNNVIKIENGPTYSEDYAWLYISGKITMTNLETNEVSVREAGFCNIDTPEKTGTFKKEVIEDAVMFCFSKLLNKKTLPKTIPFKLMANEKTELPLNTKLFLASGTFKLSNDEEFSGEIQVTVNDFAKTITAKTDCYGLIFP